MYKDGPCGLPGLLMDHPQTGNQTAHGADKHRSRDQRGECNEAVQYPSSLLG